MLTSESNYLQFQGFIHGHLTRLKSRLTELVNTRYRRALILAAQKGTDIPPVFGSIKIDDDISLYGCLFGVKFRRNDFDVKAFMDFLIMKDLRKQTRIMVVGGADFIMIYSTHAISRYKERLGLNPDMSFVEVCKHMVTKADCGSPKIIKTFGEVYGTNPKHITTNMVCLNGAFMGYFSEETEVFYAETFLSPNEMRENQAFMDVNTDPAWSKWKEQAELVLKGKLRSEEVEDMFPPDKGISVRDGSLNFLTESENKQQIEEFDQYCQENPDYKEKLIDKNRQRLENRLKLKGLL